MSRKPGYNIQNMDALEYLRAVPDEVVDCIFTDHAYESLEKHRSIGTTTRLQDWFEIFPDLKVPELVHHLYRVLKNNRHCYLMCDEPTMFVLQEAVKEETDFKWWKAVVWDKQSAGNGYHYRTCHEFIVFLEKGKLPLRDRTKVKSVVQFKPYRKRDKYPTQKPVEMVQFFLEQSVKPRQVVMDPFMGSGVTGIAAANIGADFWGNDISMRSYMATGTALAKMELQPCATPSLLFKPKEFSLDERSEEE